MKKIIHLSDLHIGYQQLDARFECAVSRIIFEKEPATNYVVVVTGDLVENAFDSGSYAIAAAHLERLRIAGFEVLVAPGNHDYGTGSLGHRKFIRKFKRVFLGASDLEYPKTDIINEVAFIGLDSMAEELNWHDSLFAQGELGQPQLQRLDTVLGRADVNDCEHRVLYLHHHPFDHRPFLELRDSGALGEIIRARANVDALLYGHNHEGKKHNGVWGVRRCYDDGSATRKGGSPGHHRVIDLAREPGCDYSGDFWC